METFHDTVQVIPGATHSYSLHQFISGFVVGQLLLLLLLFAVIKLVFLRNGEEEIKKRRPKPQRMPQLPGMPLEDFGPFEAEGCGWLNVLVAQAVERYRSDPVFQRSIVEAMHRLLNSARPEWCGEIDVDLFSLGQSLPSIKSARLQPSSRYKPNNYRVDLDVEWSTTTMVTLPTVSRTMSDLPDSNSKVSPTGLSIQTFFPGREFIESGPKTAAENLTKNSGVAFGVSTQAILHWPRPYFAALPISLALSIVRFSGLVSVEFVAETEGQRDSYGMVSVAPDFELEFDVRSLLGHNTKVKDLPKLTELLVSRIKSTFIETFVEPNACRMQAPTAIEMLEMMGILPVNNIETTDVGPRRRSHLHLGPTKQLHEHHS